MKRWWISGWDVQSARINALGARERVLLFLSVIAICMLLVNGVWLSPAQVVNQQLTQRFDTQSAELQRVRDEMQPVATPVYVNKALRDEIAAVKISLDAVNQTITGVLSVATEEPLAQVLVHLLRQNEGLTLLRTSTLVAEGTVDEATEPFAADAYVLPFGLTRQGVELTVSGAYLELMRYVQTLENALPHVHWGSMKLKSEKPPTELTLQLFLIGDHSR
ncbi:MAG: MSHA biogenesis protein MshJ [Porticoccus sp.]|jgi:MSHA biogenesis protein MshJ